MKTLPCILALAESSLEPRGLDGLNRQGPDSKTLLLLKGTNTDRINLGIPNQALVGQARKFYLVGFRTLC